MYEITFTENIIIKLDVFQKNIRQIKLIISLLESDNY